MLFGPLITRLAAKTVHFDYKKLRTHYPNQRLSLEVLDAMGFFNVYNNYVFCEPGCTPEEDRVLSPQHKNNYKLIDLYSDQVKEILEEAKRHEAQRQPEFTVQSKTIVIQGYKKHTCGRGKCKRSTKRGIIKGQNPATESEDDTEETPLISADASTTAADIPTQKEQREEELEINLQEQQTSEDRIGSPIEHDQPTTPRAEGIEADPQITSATNSAAYPLEEDDMTTVLNIARASMETAERDIPRHNNETEPVNSSEQ